MPSSDYQLLTYQFRPTHHNRPVLLLGAGASFRAGIPLAEESVRRIARAAYAVNVKGMDWRHVNVLPDDWMPHLQRQPWFLRDKEQFAENFPLAVEHFLNPQEFRRQFFMDLIQPPNNINEGYRDLARLMMRRLCWTVLTTNFDSLVVDALREVQPHLPTLVEINRTADDLVRFDVNNRVQIVYLHGAVEFYRDKNLVDETQRLDEMLVSKLRPLLSGCPLIVVGYRGSEPSVTEHLLAEGIKDSGGYPHGIFWCTREPDQLHPNVLELQSRIGKNFRLVEINGFDELMQHLYGQLKDDIVYSSADFPLPLPPYSPNAVPFEQQVVSGATLDNIDRELALVTLKRYCEHVGLPVVNEKTAVDLMLELGLLTKEGETISPTKSGYLLFGREASEKFPFSRISFTTEGKKQVVFEGNLITQHRDLVQILTSAEVNPTLRVKTETGADEKPAYPIRAVTELIVNMIVHRDYAMEAYSRVEFKPGHHLRFRNPGGLLSEVREKMSVKKDGPFSPVRAVTELRNQRLAAIFYGLRSMDKAGSGLVDVRDLMTEHGGRAEFAVLQGNTQLEATLLQPLQLAPQRDRVARRRSELEVFTTNLLPIQVVPEVLYRLPLRPKPFIETPLFESGENPRDNPIFIQHDNELLSFANFADYPMFAERRGYLDQLIEQRISSYITNSDNRNVFVWLLGKHWSFFLERLGRQGLVVEHKKKRAYFRLMQGLNYTITYDSRVRKNVKRDVVKRRERRDTVEHENEGIYYAVVEYGGNWAIQIRPFYMFTREDGVTPIPSFLIARRATRRIKFDRNKNVDHDLTFWAQYLSKGQQTVNIGGLGVDNLIMEFEYCSAEVPISRREAEADEDQN